MKKLKSIVRLARPHQYVKNGFVLMPLFFGARLHDANAAVNTFLAFAVFCFAASAIYIVNDLGDVAEDRRHPVKRFRPLARGDVTITEGLCIFAALVIPAGALSFMFLPAEFFRFVGMYIILNLMYSFFLKHLAVMDMLCIALGFVLRVFAGGAAANVAISPWIILMTFLLALFLALSKRRDELLLVERGNHTRKSLGGYDTTVASAAMVVMAFVIIGAYVLYSVSDDVARKHGADNLYTTCVWVILGLLRYMQLTFVKDRRGSPTEVLLRDPCLQAVVLLWLANIYWLIY